MSARIEERTDEAIDGLQGELQQAETRLIPAIEKKLGNAPALPWTSPVANAAAKLAGKAISNRGGRRVGQREA